MFRNNNMHFINIFYKTALLSKSGWLVGIMCKLLIITRQSRPLIMHNKSSKIWRHHSGWLLDRYVWTQMYKLTTRQHLMLFHNSSKLHADVPHSFNSTGSFFWSTAGKTEPVKLALYQIWLFEIQPASGTQIQQEPDLGRTCFGITEQYTGCLMKLMASTMFSEAVQFSASFDTSLFASFWRNLWKGNGFFLSSH